MRGANLPNKDWILLTLFFDKLFYGIGDSFDSLNKAEAKVGYQSNHYEPMPWEDSYIDIQESGHHHEQTNAYKQK